MTLCYFHKPLLILRFHLINSNHKLWCRKIEMQKLQLFMLFKIMIAVYWVYLHLGWLQCSLHLKSRLYVLELHESSKFSKTFDFSWPIYRLIHDFLTWYLVSLQQKGLKLDTGLFSDQQTNPYISNVLPLSF